MPPKKPLVVESNDPMSSLVSFRVKLFGTYEPPEDLAVLLEWFDGDKSRCLDTGEIRDWEIFSGDLPLTPVAEADAKKDAKKDPKAKKKNEGVVFEAGKKYQGFFEFAEDDVKVDEVRLAHTGVRPQRLQQAAQAAHRQHRRNESAPGSQDRLQQSPAAQMRKT